MVALLLSIVVATPSIIFYLVKPLGGSKLQPKPANMSVTSTQKLLLNCKPQYNSKPTNHLEGVFHKYIIPHFDSFVCGTMLIK
ncbi:hypothetical protein PAULFLAKE_2 [Enterococcus phage vB_EfaS_Paulomi]|nr:hypothetical protein PAULFLAKE_2 [Enterococcus phage vB_EfaS_Paulomi]